MSDGQYRWRFASHLRFPYWALNMKLHHQLLSQSRIYLQHNPNDAEMSTEDLRSLVADNS